MRAAVALAAIRPLRSVRFASAALAGVMLALSAPLVYAQDCPRTTLADVEDEVMCPICGTPLALATEAPQAQRQRAFIERLIDDCRTKDEVKRALVAQFGEGVLALPGDEGDDDLGDVLVYAIPALGVLVALGGIAIAAVRWRRRGDPGATGARGTASGAAGNAASRRLQDDFDRYDL